MVLEKCRYVSNNSNDGDSFHVKAGGKEYLFRLYFVDAPETDTAFPDRIAEQAKYFEVTPEQVVKIGETAKRFTKEKLGAEFTVRTSMHGARGQSQMERYYAFVETSSGNLAELLVENGLARVYGAEAKPVGLSHVNRQWARLERLEREAKNDKRGAWGINAGRLSARAPKKAKEKGADGFDEFFHPEVAAASPTPEAKISPAVTPPAPSVTKPITLATPKPTPSIAKPITVITPKPTKAADANGKLDINKAAPEQLESLPGVGEVIAQRIIDARPFKSADDLETVKGIGPKTYEKLRPHFK